MAAQEQHRAFTLVRNNMAKARKQQLARANEKTEDVEFGVVFYKNHRKTSKLDRRWKPNYVVTEKTGPVSYLIKDQLTSAVTKAHASQLKMAKIDCWEAPEAMGPTRRAALAIPPDSDSSDEEGGERTQVRR